ncbi:unnamed protein product, partial [Ectocarpus sp. 12 AP-2014]
MPSIPLQPQQPPRSSTRLISAEYTKFAATCFDTHHASAHRPSTTTIFATTATTAGRMVCQ